MVIPRTISEEIESLKSIQTKQDEIVRLVRELEMDVTETSFSLLVTREIRELENLQKKQTDLIKRVRVLEAEWASFKMQIGAGHKI